jgi:hypothetical protein
MKPLKIGRERKGELFIVSMRMSGQYIFYPKKKEKRTIRFKEWVFLKRTYEWLK